jgi:hypothetical protein
LSKKKKSLFFLGGLLTDLGVLTLKPADSERGLKYYNDNALRSGQTAVEVVPMFEADDPVIVEWRAMTVVLIDVIAKEIQESLGLNKEQLNLAQVLEAGTWKVPTFNEFCTM